MLKNFRESDVEGCFEGECEFPLFNTDITVFINMEELDLDYVNKCLENLKSLNEKDVLVDKLCEYSIRYCEDYRELFEECEIDIPENIKGREILKYIEPVIVGIEEPDDKNSIGYSIELNVAWEEEHGMEWDIRDNRILYVSLYNGMGAWCDNYDDGCNYALETEDFRLIRHLSDVGGYYEGYFKSRFFDDEMIIAIASKDDVEYAEKCIENFNSFSDDTMKMIWEKCIEFFRDMYAEYSDDYDEDCNPENLTPENILDDYVEGVSIEVGNPENTDICAYVVEVLCPIDCPVCVVKDNKIIYIGENTGISPWDDLSDCENNYIKE